MTGPEHYTEAERLLKAAPDLEIPAAASMTIATAQVHATLALAAATAIMAAATDAIDDKDGEAWIKVASEYAR